jgi:hypothetical protein
MTEREKPWTAERLRALLPGADADVVPLLNEPEEHLPPARFFLEPAGWKFGLALPELENGQLTASSYAEYWLEADLALQSQPLREWKKERREAFEQEARRVLREGDERTRQQWNERIKTLDAVLDGVADEKEKGRTYPGQMSAEERRTGLVVLEKRTLRARAKYASRREVLRQEEDRRAHTGKPSAPKAKKTTAETGNQITAGTPGRKVTLDDPSAHPAKTLNAVLKWTDTNSSGNFRGENSLCGFVSERLVEVVGYKIPQDTIKSRLRSLMNELNVELPHGATNALSYIKAREEVIRAMEDCGLSVEL